MNLFNFGNFVLHSGQLSKFKIDCDALVGFDWDAIAELIVHVLPNPVEIYDVLTTGASLMKAAVNIVPARRYGIVLFARGPVEHIPFPVFTVFTLDKQLY